MIRALPLVTRFDTVPDENGRHKWCYFCHPEKYPTMPEFHTLCARCGVYMRTDVRDDPMNEYMQVCPQCEEDMARDGYMRHVR